MTKLQTALFDLDGTLLDSVELIVQSYQHTCQVHHLRTPSRQEILAGIGTPLRSALLDLAGDQQLVEECLVTYREFNHIHHDDMVKAYPGVVELVQRLRTEGIRTGLVTSKIHAGARRGLKLIGLEDTLEVIIGADDVTHHKPHAEPVIKALHLLGMPTDTAIFVGDSLFDMNSGRAAGVRTVGITWGPFDRAHLAPSEPTWFADSPEQILGIVTDRD